MRKTIAVPIFTFDNFLFQQSPKVPDPRCGSSKLLADTVIDQIQIDGTPTQFIAMGDGAGHLGIKIAFHYPDCQVISSDISPMAIQTITTNAALNNIQNLTTIRSDLLENITIKPNTYVAFNPPQLSVTYAPKNAIEEWEYTTNFVEGDSLSVVSRTLIECKKKGPSGCPIFFSLISLLGEKKIDNTFSEQGLTYTILNRDRIPLNRKSVLFSALYDMFRDGGLIYPDSTSCSLPFTELEALTQFIEDLPQKPLFFEVWILKTVLK